MKNVDGKDKCSDLTKNGICTGCGECCASMLPTTFNEADYLKKLIKARNIKPHSNVIISTDVIVDLTCPFLLKDKTKDRCSIYDERPIICRNFICNKGRPNLVPQNTFIVNMWNLFGKSGIINDGADMLTTYLRYGKDADRIEVNISLYGQIRKTTKIIYYGQAAEIITFEGRTVAIPIAADDEHIVYLDTYRRATKDMPWNRIAAIKQYSIL